MNDLVSRVFDVGNQDQWSFSSAYTPLSIRQPLLSLALGAYHVLPNLGTSIFAIGIFDAAGM